MSWYDKCPWLGFRSHWVMQNDVCALRRWQGCGLVSITEVVISLLAVFCSLRKPWSSPYIVLGMSLNMPWVKEAAFSGRWNPYHLLRLSFVYSGLPEASMYYKALGMILSSRIGQELDSMMHYCCPLPFVDNQNNCLIIPQLLQKE